MEIKKALQKLSEPQKYGPTLVGGVAGVFGGVYALDYLKNWVASAAPDNDAADWLAKGAFTAVAVMGMLTITPKRAGDVMGVIAQSVCFGAAVTGGIVMLIKALGWTPLTIGRVGATGGIARTRVKVVQKPTPTYSNAPVVNSDVPSVFGAGMPREADPIGGY